MEGYFHHSVRLDREKCKGCVNCIKRCPTEAIRVRKGKAEILEEKCIDCGECVRACPNRAKYVQTDSLDLMDSFSYRIALAPPSLYGQFREPVTPAQVLTALTNLGFDDVIEAAVGAEIVSAETRKLFKEEAKGPLISSACPAVVRLIQVRFPELTRRILPLEAPTEVAAQVIREARVRETGLAPEEIGIFFITPCAAKVTSIKAPEGGCFSNIDGAFSVHQLYRQLNRETKKIKRLGNYQRASGLGVGWGISGGELSATGLENHLVVDGIHNVISVLDELEMGRLGDIDFIEAQACTGGCVGGFLNVRNSYVARVRLQKIARELNQVMSPLQQRWPELSLETYQVPRIRIKPRSAVYFDDDLNLAMAKMAEAEKVLQGLPGLDCGACGAPNCKALAEDIVLDKAEVTDCIFILRERIMALALDVYGLAKIRPPAMSQEIREREGEE